jgi:hypothetical protein
MNFAYTLRTALVGIIVAVAVAGWIVAQGDLYRSGSDFGYSLGLVGGSMMLTLFLYPLRKRAHFMRRWGPLKHWFRAHMFLGVWGPTLVLFHSTFNLGSLNATVALTCMMVVACSGLIGRFIYKLIHHGLYGTRATAEEMKQALARLLDSIQPVLAVSPAVKIEVDGFAARADAHPPGSLARAGHFMSLGWQRWRALRRIRRALAATGREDQAAATLAGVMQSAEATLRAIQIAAQFSTYERLFSLWHLMHVPFVGVLVITAIVHVVAVHMY